MSVPNVILSSKSAKWVNRPLSQPTSILHSSSPLFLQDSPAILPLPLSVSLTGCCEFFWTASTAFCSCSSSHSTSSQALWLNTSSSFARYLCLFLSTPSSWTSVSSSAWFRCATEDEDEDEEESFWSLCFPFLSTFAAAGVVVVSGSELSFSPWSILWSGKIGKVKRGKEEMTQ